MQGVKLDAGRALEIGPLHRPLLKKRDGDVLYCDHFSTEQLVEKYAPDPGVDTTEIVPVDLVVGPLGLHDAARSHAPYSFIVASHVMEHVPNLLGWLQDIHRLLDDDGILCLALPDRRYTFDLMRRSSRLKDVLAAHAEGRVRPSIETVCDAYLNSCAVDAKSIWRGGLDLSAADVGLSVHSLRAALQRHSAGEYIDVHCWVFSPLECVKLLNEVLTHTNIWFEPLYFRDTCFDEEEFHLQLCKRAKASSQGRWSAVIRDAQSDCEMWTERQCKLPSTRVEMAVATYNVPEPDLPIPSDISPHTYYIPVDYKVTPKTRSPSPRLLQRIADREPAYGSFLTRCLSYVDHYRSIAMNADDRTSDAEPFWLNSWYGGFDAISLYGILGLHAPSSYIEVGSGISTRFARRAVKDLRLATRITSIDPSPRAEMAMVADNVLSTRLEDSDLSIYADLRAGDVVMLDGSHRTFQNSDVTVFFTDIIPLLKPGVVIGIHDIFLPFDYPEIWHKRFYNEQYMLASYLLGGSRADIILPVFYVSQTPSLATLLKPIWDDPRLGPVLAGGGMFWFTNA